MKTWLVDTGPIISYLDAADPVHAEVSACWDAFRGQLATSSAVITEAMHFVSATAQGARNLAALVAASGMEIYDMSRPPEVHEAVSLMETYLDTPMDFADATLVLLAEALQVQEVFTLDRRGFSTYRTRKRRAFRLVLDLA